MLPCPPRPSPLPLAGAKAVPRPDAEAHGRVLLVEGTLPGFLRSAQRRLYCAPEDAAAQLMESRPTSPAARLWAWRVGPP